MVHDNRSALQSFYLETILEVYDICMATTEKTEARLRRQSRTSNAFLLAQLGAHATALFAERIAALDLTPPQAGFLRLVAIEPGSSQQAIARRLTIAPSRLVPIVDGLEQRGLIERRRDPDDRRNHALYLTAEGGRFMGQLGQTAAAHDDALFAALDTEERQQLGELLRRVAAHQGLEQGIHPGYGRTGQ
jgi:DNA-binding MarR family transcriptional regulator